ncbi:MAG: competence protein ComEC [Alphaproteobacteria bacterium]|nr:MAG: competence protein ComEC [Alphaproteobacteria bacterium]
MVTSALPDRQAGFVRRLAEWLSGCVADDRDRWALWIPVAGGTGVAAYFALPAEPASWSGAATAAAAAAAAVLLRRRPVAVLAAGLLLAAALGFAAAQLRSALVAAPMLDREIDFAEVSGRVIELAALPDGRRLLLDSLAIEGLPPEATPQRIRVKVARGAEALGPGDRVRLLAGLAPPSPPLAPGAFDFQRNAYFERIGGYGFSYGAPREITPAAGGDLVLDLRLRIAGLRHAITERVLAVLPGGTGALAAALMTGSQAAIPEEVMVAMRDSGLAHLLSISGLHVGLLAGIVFIGLRGGLALVPAIALRYPIKKWAAVAALAATLFYTLLAGAPVPTQRAFLMTGLVLLAVVVDRNPFNMRMVAWAAAAILLLAPEALVGPSFQMSFAAVVALIAAYEASRDWRNRRRAETGWPLRGLRYAGGLTFTSLIAGAATAPYAVFHFGRMANYGVLANMLAVPLTGLWIMPWAVAAFLLMPLGLERFALIPMGWGVDGVIRIAELVAAWPGAAALLPAMPVWGLASVTFGGLWLCFWQRNWRLLGVAPILAGLASVALLTPPHVLVSGDGRLLAVRGADGGLLLSSLRVESFTAEGWLRRMADDAAERWPEEGASPDGSLACDGLGCIYRAEGHVVALAVEPAALEEDCHIANVVVSLSPLRRPCPSAGTVVDRFDLWRDGAHALWLTPDGIEVQSVDETRGDRPWVVRPGRDE